MELDVHYYLVYKVAVLAGFGPQDAETIAYASQYVDDATESEPITVDGERFDTVRTAHYGIWAFDWNVQKKIFIPFHFLPPKARSRKSYSYATQKGTDSGCDLNRNLFDVARNEQEEDRGLRLIRIGVAVHAIADTFSHYGFSGRWDDENAVSGICVKENDDWDREIIMSLLYDVVMPRIGHAEAGKYPDCPYMLWKYENGQGKEVIRNNFDDTIACADYLYKLLTIACSGSETEVSLASAQPEAFDRITGLLRLEGDLDTRCAEWIKYTGLEAYSPLKWREDALHGKIKWDHISPARLKSLSFRAKKGFYRSSWANFHRAAFKQRCRVLEWLS